jgi:hypothetical protein
MAALLSLVMGGRWELNPQETCSTDMPDVPIVGTATVGAPGVTGKPTLLITNQPLCHLSCRCELCGAGSGDLTRILRDTEATL